MALLHDPLNQTRSWPLTFNLVALSLSLSLDYISLDSSSFLRMIKEFMQKKDVDMGGSKAAAANSRRRAHPELSLGPSLSNFAESSSSESEANHCRKRKHYSTWDDQPISTRTHNIDLQVDHPLPFDWEQCLDLQTGRMYYLNKKTMKKRWSRPKEPKLDLDLNISILPSSEDKLIRSMTATLDHDPANSNTNSVFAVPCLKCHLLVMLSKSSPSCPNCKYVHLLPPPKIQTPTKPLQTLKLLN